MRIAQVAPLYEAVPPRFYGGTERIVAHLTDALVELGHEVTLFASAEARTRATLVPVRDQAIRLRSTHLTGASPERCPSLRLERQPCRTSSRPLPFPG